MALRAVQPGEKPPPKARVRKLSVSEAASKGTVREQLVAIRQRVAEAVESPNCAARDLAALTRRLMELTREIEAIDARAAEEADAEGAGVATPDDDWEAG